MHSSTPASSTPASRARRAMMLKELRNTTGTQPCVAMCSKILPCVYKKLCTLTSQNTISGELCIYTACAIWYTRAQIDAAARIEAHYARNKQARQTKCQDHTTVDTVRESLSTPHQSLGGAADSHALKPRSTSIATRKITRYSSAAFKSTSWELKR